MKQKLKDFIEFLKENPKVAEEVNTLDANDEMLNSKIVSIAKEHGFDLTEEDLQQSEGELDASELASVTGGGDCYCVIGGGGTKDMEGEMACGCVVAGQGCFTEGDSVIPINRCVCNFYGQGEALYEL